jgi:peptidase MA superfamily protein
MLFPSKNLFAAFFLAVSIGPAAFAQSPTSAPGLNALPEVEFSRLSQRDPTPLGQKALAINPKQWKHGETEHFIYHFVDSFVVTPLSVEAEFHYRVVAKELQREQPAGDTKSHIYIFQRPADWQQFQSAGKLEPWTGGIQSQGSLFILRDPAYKFSGNVLGHEIAHLIIHRYYPDGIPCWLNEGFAQYVSKGARASYQRARNYTSKPHSQAIVEEKLIPLTELMAMTYPPSDRVETFYDESERLVRFLALSDKASFLAFLDALGRHQPFESALVQSYGAKFLTTAALEEKFREYASKEFGTSLQQAGGG